jgi:hypothetical protein
MILALNRIAKLNALIKYENISIGINNNSKINGASGIKIFRNFVLCLANPSKNIESHKEKENDPIIII